MRPMPCLGLRCVYVQLVLLVLYSSAPAQELRRIHYGTTTSTAHLPVWVAKDAGLFAKNGLNVEPVHIRGGALITMAIMSGNLQFSGAGAESVVAARIEGGDVVLLACPVDSDPVYLIARPVLVDLSKTDLVYPSSCVASSRAFVKAEPRLVEDFLRAYVAGVQLIKKD